MLNLDAISLPTKVFTYDLPEPYGPDRGKAKLEISAKPYAITTPGVQSKLRYQMTLMSTVIPHVERLEDEGHDAEAAMRSTAALEEVHRSRIETIVNSCVVSWKSDIQNEGKDIETTKENLVELLQFPSPDLQFISAQFIADVQKQADFHEQIKAEAEAETVKN